jgi:hypothetical protein
MRPERHFPVSRQVEIARVCGPLEDAYLLSQCVPSGVRVPGAIQPDPVGMSALRFPYHP